MPAVSSAANSGQSAPMAMEKPAVMLGRDPVTGQLRSLKDPKRQTPADLKTAANTSRANDLGQGSGDSDPARGGIAGLDVIPKGWPELPGNVSLGVEIAWVQSERLSVVKELPTGRIKVDLIKASVPAPSKSAIGWLETSIRSYAKFIEVASKQAGSSSDEAEFVRKERMAIGEIRSILAEMLVDKRGS